MWYFTHTCIPNSCSHKKSYLLHDVNSLEYRGSHIHWLCGLSPIYKRLKFWKNVYLKTSLETNPSNSFSIFLLGMNFKNLTVELHVLIISSMLTKFQKKLKINSYLINKMFNIQVQIVNNIWFKWNLTSVLKT